MVGHYENFFIASTGASAAILGLRVVAVATIAFYGSALAWAWEVTGITRRV